MGRTGHWITPTKAGWGPRCVVSVIVDKDFAVGAPEGCKALPAKCGLIWASWRRMIRGEWSAVGERCFTSPADFWRWLERWAWSGRRVYVFAPVASDALTLLGFWPRITREGARFSGSIDRGGRSRRVALGDCAFTFDRLVLRGRPDIISYSYNRKRYTWLSVANYFAFTSSQLIHLVGGEWNSSDGTTTAAPLSSLTSRERCSLHLAAMCRLGDWWTSMDAGGFGCTVGALAYSFLRSRMKARSICTHKDERVCKLERLACHGGRASTWFYGDVVHRSHVPEPEKGEPDATSRWRLSERLYHLDVKSMYPSLMTHIWMPRKLLSYVYNPTPKDVLDLLKGQCVVASVEVETDQAEYPHRSKDRVIYPVGRFNAVLCGDELEEALKRGHVRQVYSAAIYARGRPFSRAATELLAMRSGVDKAKDPGWESFVKLLSNSTTGKLAQNPVSWVPRPDVVAEKEWGEWPHLDAETGRVTRYQARADMVWEMVRDQPGKGTLTACYAHITSAGRTMMRRLRESCPPRSVVSQDTDGIWVTAVARDCLLSRRDAATTPPGSVRLVASSSRSRHYGPKHYYAAGEWTLSGLHDPKQMGNTLSFFDEWTNNGLGRGVDRPPEYIHIHTREVVLSVLAMDGSVGPDGWQVPDTYPHRVNRARIETGGAEPDVQRPLPFAS